MADVEEIVEEEIIEDKNKKGKKSKKDKNENVEENVNDSIQDSFDAFMSNTSKIDKGVESKLYIPSGLDYLDCIMGGGLGMKFSMLVGMSGCGKSALATRFLRTGQRLYGNQFIGIYADSELTMSEERLEQLGVVGIKPIFDISVEKIFKIVESVCVFKEKNPSTIEIPSLIVWDSIANSHTESQLDSDELVQTSGAQKAKILTHYLPIYISKMNKYNVALLGINHIHDDINMEGNKYSKPPKDLRFLKFGKLPGGKSLQYNSYQLLELQQKEIYTDKDGTPIYGFDAVNVKITAIKNKRFSPNIPIEVVFGFKTGFNNFWTNFNLLVEFKRIKTGAWFELNSCPKTFRKNKALELYNTDPVWKEAFNNEVKDVLKTEYIEKDKIEKNDSD